MPKPGEHILRILTPTLLELTLVTTIPLGDKPAEWDFVGPNFTPKIPNASQFEVDASGKKHSVARVGFKRRPLYAPLKQRDLRVLNHLYLELTEPIPPQGVVEVRNPDKKVWSTIKTFRAKNDPLRFNPSLHVNQVGYQLDFPKKAMVGYYLGSLGELKITGEKRFEIIDALSGKKVFEGQLRQRPDHGFTYSPAPYQEVFEADFSQLNSPGTYRLLVPGMGASYPFQIGAATMGVFARTYALGLYHQRCGTNNLFPFTRHVHDTCHTAPAEVPNASFSNAQRVIAEVSSDAKEDPRHTAPQLKDFSSSLYPFVREGKVDVTGGHHDAGDYSKYTINSAALVHYLVFAADNFKGAGDLDNLGLPESGDGKSDLLQEAKWEADFLAKMQDNDGGFYFLVYPKERRYEDNVLPDKGDPQIVWPKNTSATAAAVAALAEAGSSPLMKKLFPEAADLYLRRARRGWAFLENAIQRHGRDGAYQKLTHYGNEFLHDDELAWAAAAMFAATGEKTFETKLTQWFNPENPETRRWTWWPMFEGYGCAARTYAFAARSGRLPAEKLALVFLARCERLIDTTAQNQVRFAKNTAYATSFPDPNKANRNAGWYFSSERAFDITVALQMRDNPEFVDAIVGNLNYEAGCNPVNVAYITGLGWRQQRELVHQYAQNDHRLLPPSGIPIGNIQGGFAYLHHYQKQLGELVFPPDGAQENPYPYYDRWGDSFNTTTEFVVVDQARILASLAALMARTPQKNQAWHAATGKITGLPNAVAAGEKVIAKLEVAGLDLAAAKITWEARGQEPRIAPQFEFTPQEVGEHWIEAEALWPDGRRVFAAGNFLVSASLATPANEFFSRPATISPGVVALYHLDGQLLDASAKSSPLKLEGKARFDSSNLSWMKQRGGAALRFYDLGDKAMANIHFPPGNEIRLEAMIFINAFKGYNRDHANILSLKQDWNASIEMIEDKYQGPLIRGGTIFSIPGAEIKKVLTEGKWHHVALSVGPGGYKALVNGTLIGSTPKSESENWVRQKPTTLEIGGFDGYIDEVIVTVGKK